MAALRGSSKISKFITNNSLLRQRGVCTSPHLSAAWNKDWMPEKEIPSPEDTKAIDEVASKYNIPPELYKPHKNPYGDYPDLGVVSQQRRDPHYPWDDYVNRRDWGEFVDLRFNLHTEDRCDPLYQRSQGFSIPFQYFMLFLVMIGGGYLFYLSEQYPVNKDYFERQLPYNIKKNDYVSYQRHVLVGNYDKNTHYTFEPAE